MHEVGAPLGNTTKTGAPDRGREPAGQAVVSASRLIRVKVKPGARASTLQPPDGDDTWRAQLKSPPVDGKANDELVKLVSTHFKCPRKAVTITAGRKGRIKRVRIEQR